MTPGTPPSSHFPRTTNRRQFFAQAGGGFGAVALSAMLARDGLLSSARAAAGKLSADPLAPKEPHFAPKAKRIIWLFMHGGPSHMDLFDYKPELIRLAGKPIPDSFGQVMTRRNVAKNTLMPPVKPFKQRGESGVWVSDFLPHIAGMADDLCVINSCHGDSVNHPQSVYQLNTGSILMGKPSFGSWIAYGLGTVNRNMPAFIVMPDPDPGGIKGGPPAWGSGFLPATYQGTTVRAGKSPILNLQPPQRISDEQQRGTLDLVRKLNAEHHAERDYDDELSARINAYELAFRMQTEAPQLTDISGESQATLELYGIDDPQNKDAREFGLRCLMARRMIERGVRFVQLYSGNTNGWDAHSNVADNHGKYCRKTDKPVAGLLKDLKQRGLLEDTLVVWGGEFGRMPMNEQGKGRDHNPWGFSYFLAGAGVRPGMTHGATDAIGLRAARDKVHVHDLHATFLHLLGLDHERLTFFHNGRDERLTDVAGRVVKPILT